MPEVLDYNISENSFKQLCSIARGDPLAMLGAVDTIKEIMVKEGINSREQLLAIINHINQKSLET